jgi:pseudouridine kinase
MGIVVIGAVFVDVKGYPEGFFTPTGRNVGRVEQVHGGVGRNIAEDIANCELRPTFVSLVDRSGSGEDVIHKLKNHKVNTEYIEKTRNGMGTWLAIFDNDGDVCASISKRPDMMPIVDILDEKGDEIFANADSVVIEICLDKEIVKRVLRLAEKYKVPVYSAVANMSIALERRDFLKSMACFVCNIQEAGILFSDDYSEKTAEEMVEIISRKVTAAAIPSMIVTMGE